VIEPRRRWPISERSSRARIVLGTVEVLARTIVVLAIVAFLVWFFTSAHDPLLH
jgi:hypothetical protein